MRKMYVIAKTRPTYYQNVNIKQCNNTDMRKTYIKDDVTHHDSKISPMILIKDVKSRVQELVRRPYTAETTSGSSVWVSHITSHPGNKCVHVLTAGQARWGIEPDQLNRRTIDL